MTTAEFNDCVKEYADGMYRFALKSSGNEEDARDIVQHAFTVLWENRESVDITKAKSYLFTLVYRKSVDRFRTAGRQKLMDVLPEKGSEVIFQAGLKKSIEKALMNLSAESRNLVLLKDMEGYSYDEIARLTGLSLSQVKVYLFRARKELQKSLEIYKYHY